MEKARLTEFEEKCIQEEPAFCSAACPFHVDVKAFLGHMRNKDMDRAFKVIENALPVPDILARICDHPCEAHCIRNYLDAPVAIGDLERICAAGRTRRKKRFLPPAKGRTAGIWGSGLSSLTAAWDLSLKGYAVTVFDRTDALGGHLRGISSAVLPSEILAKEIQALKSFGVEFRTADSPDAAFPSRTDLSFDAVYIGEDCPGEPFTGFDRDDTGRPLVDGFFGGTSHPRIFAGGFLETGPPLDTRSHPVAFAAQGRKAATSMDRLLSKVSPTAGREREGAISTRLSTDISGVTPCPRLDLIEDPGTGAVTCDRDLAAREADRCIQCDCSRCLRVCTYLTEFKGYPRRYAREIYNNAAIVKGEKKANLLINSCSLCRLCETVCPNDFSMADLCLEARQEMVQSDRMPVSAHDFALQEMAHAAGDACFFARHAPGSGRSDQIFFPGCQLLGSAPDQVTRVYDFLLANLSGSIGFATGCCGAPARWAGRPALEKETLARFTSFWEDADRPTIITACSSCTWMLSRHLPDADIVSLYKTLLGLKDCLPAVPRNTAPEPVNIIDPCTAREDHAVQDTVRTLARSAGVIIQELPAAGALTECCGFGGLVFNANPKLTQKINQQRAGQSDLNFLAYCAMCRDRLAKAGKKTAHLLDLFWPQTDHPEQRKDPGFSGRHDNLAQVKHRMLAELWQESPDPALLKGPAVPVRYNPGVRQVLEDHFILESDIAQVLAHIGTGTPPFYNPDNGTHIAFFRPGRVCFWVAFQKHETGIEIVNAWSHRMQVIPNTLFVPGTPTEPHNETIVCRSCDNGELGFFKNHVEYLGSRFDVVLPQCRHCGKIYISPDIARGRMAEVEKILEDK
jgi:Fe-S oxidoreductase